MLALPAPSGSSSQSKGSARGSKNKKQRVGRGKAKGHELRADHGFGQPEILSSFPLVIQATVLEVSEGAVQRRISMQAQALLHWLRHGGQALQFLPLTAIEAQLISCSSVF